MSDDVADEGAGPALVQQDRRRPERHLPLIIAAIGTLLVLLVGITNNLMDVQGPWDRFIMSLGAALLCGATISQATVRLKDPITGQVITLGGTFAMFFVTMQFIPSPLEPHWAGKINITPAFSDVALRRLGGVPLFHREIGDSIEFMVMGKDDTTSFWNITVVVGGKPKGIYCLDGNLLERPALNRQRQGYAIVWQDLLRDDGPPDKVLRLQTDPQKQPVGRPDISESACGAIAPPAAGLHRPVAPSNLSPAPGPKPPTVLASPALPPSIPELPPANAIATVKDATQNLSAVTLGQRLQASADLGTATTAVDGMVESVRSWTTEGGYDDDLGHLLAWLKPLRRLSDKPEPARKLLDTLSNTQADYLIALLANDDRQLRQSAREVVGWLLQVGNNPAGIDRLLRPIADNLPQSAPALRSMEAKFGQAPSPRKPFVFNLISVQDDAWCNLSTVQRSRMKAALDRARDVGETADAKRKDLIDRTCS